MKRDGQGPEAFDRDENFGGDEVSEALCSAEVDLLQAAWGICSQALTSRRHCRLQVPGALQDRESASLGLNDRVLAHPCCCMTREQIKDRLWKVVRSRAEREKREGRNRGKVKEAFVTEIQADSVLVFYRMTRSYGRSAR